MKSNGLIKWLMVPALLLLIFVVVKSCSGGPSSTPNGGTSAEHLSPEEMKRLGIEGDTPMDTVATLVGQTSFVDLLPWVEYLPDSQCMLLEDGESVAAFFELTQIGTEGREPDWLCGVRDALENALQDSFDELEEQPWVVQMYAQDETNWDDYLQGLRDYVHPRAKGSEFTECYLQMFEQHLRAISKPGGLFEDSTVTRLPWRGQTRRVRMVVYRRSKGQAGRRGQNAEQALNAICDRLQGGLRNVGVKCTRMEGPQIHHWLLRWFNPKPALLGPTEEDRKRFYELTAYPQTCEPGELELASGTDFAQRLFFNQPQSDVDNGLWYFDQMPHRVVTLDRLRSAPSTGHLTGETRKGGDATNALFDQMPEDSVLCITILITPQDMLEAHLNLLAKKSVGEAQKKLMLSARKESGKFTEGVILSKSTEVLFRAVPPSLYLAMAMTEPEEKAERFRIMGEMGVSELDAAIEMGRRVDSMRGIGGSLIPITEEERVKRCHDDPCIEVNSAHSYYSNAKPNEHRAKRSIRSFDCNTHHDPSYQRPYDA
jgi:hypothetical protein